MKRRIATSASDPVVTDLRGASEYKNPNDHYPRDLEPRRSLMQAWDSFNTERGMPQQIEFPSYIPVSFLEYYAPQYVGLLGPPGPQGPPGEVGPGGTIQVFAQQTSPPQGSTPWLWIQLDAFGDVIGEQVYVP
jgi:hypothetical protein